MITYHNGIILPSHKRRNSGFYLSHNPKRYGSPESLVISLAYHQNKINISEILFEMKE